MPRLTLHRAPRFWLASALFGALAWTGSAAAEVELGAFVRHGAVKLPRAMGASVSSIVELPAGGAAPPHFVHVGTTATGREIGVVELSALHFPALTAAFPEASFGWSPPLKLLLDRASGWTNLAPFRNTTKLTGRGVVLGMVDTGIDPTHRDLRDANGKSRTLYWLDFSRERANLHRDMEDALGCRTDPTDDSGTPCAVYTGKDIDDLVNDDDPGNDPSDFSGHGTHVASIAGGTGLATTPVRYVGVAPEASFIIARVARKSGDIFDGDVLKATSFVFERAEELGMPAVVNLSLGTDFGGHDGTSPSERGLESLVGDAHPGRAIVVAAGNSAGLYRGVHAGVPEPLGVHTEVHVAKGASTLVPIVTPLDSATQGTVYVWITLRPGDALGLGVEHRAGTLIAPIGPGSQASVDDGLVEVTIVNGVTSAQGIPPGSYGAAVIIDGQFSSDDVFGLRLEGPASARLWVEGDGGLSPEQSVGPLLPRAEKAGTINLPGCSPGLIAVGATVNRTDWTDFAGEAVTMPAFAGLADATGDSSAFFSSAGPNALGVMKPDLVAPGANVIAAMASNADPRAATTPAGGMFDDLGACADGGYADYCFVADDTHALSGGTSMSSPIVSGAIALLFERDPALTEGQARALLQAGARRLQGDTLDPQQLGAGALDLERTLEALDDRMTAQIPGSQTTLLVSDSFAHPDSSWPLSALLELRDDADHIVDGFDTSRLSVDVTGATLAERPLRLAPGLWRFSVVAPAKSGGTSLALDVRFDGRSLVHKDVPIAVDPALVANLPSARGGCAVTRGDERGPGGVVLGALVAALGVTLGRRRRRGVERRAPAA